MSPSRRTVTALAATYAIGGVVSALLPQPHERAISFFLGVATMIAIYIWCKQESAQRNAIPPGRSALWAAIFSPVFLPVSFFRTRPTAVAVRLSLKAYAIYFGLCLIMFLGAVAAIIAGHVTGAVNAGA